MRKYIMKLIIIDDAELYGDELDEIGRLLKNAGSKFVKNIAATEYEVRVEVEEFILVNLIRQGVKEIYKK
jgi:hypothetical protein